MLWYVPCAVNQNDYGLGFTGHDGALFNDRSWKNQNSMSSVKLSLRVVKRTVSSLLEE